MHQFFNTKQQHSFVFLGEAGCGKSEIAVNLAISLAQKKEKAVHFFDMDMTKPLFRSRDLTQMLREQGVTVHFEQQFMDAPTMVGGVSRLLRNPDCYTVLDIGGDEIGARAVGAYAPILNNNGCAVYYVVNPYRPWSADLEHIDGVLSATLGSAHVQFDRLHFIGNPNFGRDTSAEEVLAGMQQLNDTLGQYRTIDFFCAEESLCRKLPQGVCPLKLYMTYSWEKET